MSLRIVRESRFRHVYGEPAKTEGCYTNVKSTATGDGNCIKVNPKYFCVAKQGGGGPVFVHSLAYYGRFETDHPVVNVHKAQVLDFDFNPLDDDVLATAGDDCQVCVTRIPTGGLSESIFKPDVNLNGHTKKASVVHWHPTANNVLASASYDKEIKIWNVETGQEVSSISHGDVPYSFEWSADGSQIVSTCRDTTVRVFDPRQGSFAHEVTGHDGTKATRGFWIPDQGLIGSVGFTRSSKRRLLFWDLRNMGATFHQKDLDNSGSVLCPFYDPDVSMLYLAGKGDGSIRYFELTNQEGFCHFLSDFRSSTPQKGVASIPKRAVDTGTAELAVFYRLTRDYVQPVQMLAPRKNANVIFQEDLYPDCYAGKSSANASDYFEGKDAEAATLSMRSEEVKAFAKLRAPQEPPKKERRRINGGGASASAEPSTFSSVAPVKKKKTSYKPPKRSRTRGAAPSSSPPSTPKSSVTATTTTTTATRTNGSTPVEKKEVKVAATPSDPKDAKIAALEEENAALKAEVRELKAQLGQ